MQNTTDTTAFENSDIQIAKNECYELFYSKVRNRIYLRIFGFWKNKECVPDFLKDWDKALLHVNPSFTVLVDMRTMITHPQSMKSLHAEAQLKVKAAGVLQVANVMPFDKIASLQIGTIAEISKLPTTNFNTIQEAELWLDASAASL
jgi:transposase-like protein